LAELVTLPALPDARLAPAAPPAPLTILHVVAPALVGGLERVVQTMAGGQRMAGHAVHVAAVLSEPHAQHPFVEALTQAGVAVHPLVVPGRAYQRERALLDQLFRQIRPDIVHTHGYRPDVLDAGVARRLGIPTISTVHGFTRHGVRGRFYEWLQRRWWRRFDAVAAVSRAQLDELVRAGLPAERLHLVRNAWSGNGLSMPRLAARARLGVPPAVFHIGWVGRLTREKGADVFVDALRTLADLPMVVSIIGMGRETGALRAQAATQAPGVDVRWHGLVPDAGSLFSAFDLFVLSSRTEGTPIALFEAMAARVPAVVTAVGGVPDVVSPDEALLVPPENPNALAAAIRSIYMERASAELRAQAALQRLTTQFSAAPWLARYEELYRRLQRTNLPREN
jgi:glycosyltransferase involved in cell wall biosynthesis